MMEMNYTILLVFLWIFVYHGNVLPFFGSGRMLPAWPFFFAFVFFIRFFFPGCN